MKSVIDIEISEFDEGTEQARYDYAKVTGQSITLKPAVFLHTETNERYCNIVGGLSYPTAVRPGFIIVLGVQNEPKVKFRVLEAIESMNVFTLIEHCVTMRSKWGFGKDSRILPYWLGDQEKFSTLIVKASAALEKRIGLNQGLYIKDLVDLREKHSFPLYVRQLEFARENDILERPSISGDTKLTIHLKAFGAARKEAEKGKTEDFPAVGLLGGMMHSLLVERPWQEDIVDGAAFNIAI